MSSLRRIKEEQDVIGDEVSYSITKSSLGGDTAQPKFYEAMVSFWSSTEAETETENKASTTVLSVENESVAPYQFTLEKFLQTQNENNFCRERSGSGNDPKVCFDYNWYGIPVQ